VRHSSEANLIEFVKARGATDLIRFPVSYGSLGNWTESNRRASPPPKNLTPPGATQGH